MADNKSTPLANLNNKSNDNSQVVNDILSKYNNFALIIIRNEILKIKSKDVVKSTNILRYYGIGAQIIKDLKIKNMILVSRSRKKIIGLDGYGIKITKQEIIK